MSDAFSNFAPYLISLLKNQIRQTMYQLGIDIGSTTIKMALIEAVSDDVQSTKEVRILATDYRRHNAEPMKVGQEMIEGILNKSSFPLGEDWGEAFHSSLPFSGRLGRGFIGFLRAKLTKITHSPYSIIAINPLFCISASIIIK